MNTFVRKIGLTAVCAGFAVALVLAMEPSRASADDAGVRIAPAIATSDNGGATIELVRHYHGGWGGGWGGGYRGYGYGGWGRSYYGGYYSRPYVGISIGTPYYYRPYYGGGYYGGYPYYGGGYYGGGYYGNCW